MSQLLTPMALKQQLSQTVAIEERLKELDTTVQSNVSTTNKLNKQVNDLETRSTDSKLLQRLSVIESNLHELLAKHDAQVQLAKQASDALIQRVADLEAGASAHEALAQRMSELETARSCYDAVLKRVADLERQKEDIVKRVQALEVAGQTFDIVKKENVEPTKTTNRKGTSSKN